LTKYGYSTEDLEDRYVGRVFSLDPVKQLMVVEMMKNTEETRILDIAKGNYSTFAVDFPTLQQLADYLVVEKHIEADGELWYFCELTIDEIDGSAKRAKTA
jgi:hypothetical protein